MPEDSQTARLIMAERYALLLNSIPWHDEYYVEAMQEGLNKFLSNLHLYLYGRRNKYHKTHFISLAALSKIQSDDYKGLVFEHMVPKDAYIQKPCEVLAQQATINVELILDLLDRYWSIATITAEEDQKINKNEMPDGWDGSNVFYRYEQAGIMLIRIPYAQEVETT
jgi:hypothetical protein